MAALERDLVTRAQAEAIAEQTMVYYQGGLSGDSCDGLDRPPKIITDADKQSLYAGTMRNGEIAVEFQYARMSDGDRTPGLEVTVYAQDGSVATSQDYG